MLLDGNELAERPRVLRARQRSTSARTARWLAYSTDFAGDERFTLRVKDLTHRRAAARRDRRTRSTARAWSADGSTLFYMTVDDAWRPYRVWRHALGTPAADDVLVHEEPDERFWVGVGADPQRAVHRASTSAARSPARSGCLDADDPTGEPVVIAPRRQGVEYAVEHHGATGS